MQGQKPFSFINIENPLYFRLKSIALETTVCLTPLVSTGTRYSQN